MTYKLSISGDDGWCVVETFENLDDLKTFTKILQRIRPDTTACELEEEEKINHSLQDALNEWNFRSHECPYCEKESGYHDPCFCDGMKDIYTDPKYLCQKCYDEFKKADSEEKKKISAFFKLKCQERLGGKLLN